MKPLFTGCALLLALASVTGVANAKGCIKGAAVGGAAGHVAGKHGVAGSAAGCLVGRHNAKKNANQQAAQANNANAANPPSNTNAAPAAK